MTADPAGSRSVAGRARGFPVARVGVCVLFVLITGGLQLWPGAAEWLRFSRFSYEQGAFWQPLASQWVHLSGWHAVGNAAAFTLIVFACGFWVRWPVQLLALCGGYAAVAVTVALDPNCSYYAGASGALHGLLAGNAVGMAWAGRPLARADASAARWSRLAAAAVLSVMTLKLLRLVGSAPEVAQGVVAGGWSFPVYHPAHVSGALGGAALVLLVLAARALLAPEYHGRN